MDALTEHWLIKIRRALGNMSKINPNLEPQDKIAGEEDLRDVLKEARKDLNETEFDSVIMMVRGQALAGRITLQAFDYLAKAVSELSGKEKICAYLGAGICAAFKGVLSGGEVPVRNGDGQRQHYALTPLPDRAKERYQIKFSISPTNTRKIVEAYGFLIQEAVEEKNQRMISLWKDQKEMFLALINGFNPELLEQ